MYSMGGLKSQMARPVRGARNGAMGPRGYMVAGNCCDRRLSRGVGLSTVQKKAGSVVSRVVFSFGDTGVRIFTLDRGIPARRNGFIDDR